MTEAEIAMLKMIKGLIISTENLNGASIANSQAIQIITKALEDFEKRIFELERTAKHSYDRQINEP